MEVLGGSRRMGSSCLVFLFYFTCIVFLYYRQAYFLLVRLVECLSVSASFARLAFFVAAASLPLPH